jgi:cytochrome c oxidase subunit 1/cytochrome c oxidase subunit I+III
VLLLLINIGISLKRGRLAGPNPWDGPSLEWATPSPPPSYNFPVIPTVASRHPLWERRLHAPETTLSSVHEGPVMDHAKETILTTSLDGDPELILKMPEDSVAPFGLTVAMSVFFVGLLMRQWWLAGLGFAGMLLAVLIWTWPRRKLAQRTGAVL